MSQFTPYQGDEEEEEFSFRPYSGEEENAPSRPQGALNRAFSEIAAEFQHPTTQQLMFATGLGGLALGGPLGGIAGALSVPLMNAFGTLFHENLREARTPEQRLDPTLSLLDNITTLGATALSPLAAEGLAARLIPRSGFTPLNETQFLRENLIEPPLPTPRTLPGPEKISKISQGELFPEPLQSPFSRYQTITRSLPQPPQQLPLPYEKPLVVHPDQIPLPLEYPVTPVETGPPIRTLPAGALPLPDSIPESPEPLVIAEGQLPLPMTTLGPKGSTRPVYEQPRVSPSITPLDPFDPALLNTRETFPRISAETGLSLSQRIQNAFSRGLSSELFTLRATGPRGKMLADNYAWVENATAVTASTNMGEWIDGLRRIYGTPTMGGRWAMTHPLGLQDIVKIPQQEYEALINLTASNGTWDISHLPPSAVDRVQRAWQLWTIGTGRTSSQLGSMGLQVKNTITGESYPMGEPSSFIPHHWLGTPISDTILQRIYQTQYANSGISYLDFAKRMQNLSQRGMQLQDLLSLAERPRGIRFHGAEEARSFDEVALAHALNTTPYDIMKQVGLDTDLFRNYWRFNHGGVKRALMADLSFEHLDPSTQATGMSKLMNDWFEATGRDPQAEEWILKFHQRFTNSDIVNDLQDSVHDAISTLKSLMNLAYMRRAVISNLNQITYPSSFLRLDSQVQEMLQRLGKESINPRSIEEIITTSGAMSPNTIMEMHTGQGLAERLSGLQMRGQGYNALDRLQRKWGASLAIFHTYALSHDLAKVGPTNPTMRRFVEEAGLNPDTLYQHILDYGGPTVEDLKMSTLVLTNKYYGSTSNLQRPLAFSKQDNLTRLLTQYKMQLANNMTAWKEAIFNAPSWEEGFKRAALFVPSATAMGVLTKHLRKAIVGAFGAIALHEVRQKHPDILQELLEGFSYGVGSIGVDELMSAFYAHDPTRSAMRLTLYSTAPVLGAIETGIEAGIDLKDAKPRKAARLLLNKVPFQPFNLGDIVDPQQSRSTLGTLTFPGSRSLNRFSNQP